MEREAPDLLERCAFESGDFFDAVPTGGDTYVLSRVIHDWDDSSAIRILRACRAALSAPAVLLLVEAVLPERAPNDPAAHPDGPEYADAAARTRAHGGGVRTAPCVSAVRAAAGHCDAALERQRAGGLSALNPLARRETPRRDLQQRAQVARWIALDREEVRVFTRLDRGAFAIPDAAGFGAD